MQNNQNRSGSAKYMKLWLTSWSHAICVHFREKGFHYPPMKLFRGVEPDLIFMLVPRFISNIEMSRGEVHASAMRQWAGSSVVGESRKAPPWPHISLPEEAVALIKEDFAEFASPVGDVRSRRLLWELVRFNQIGGEWREYAALVLDFLELPHSDPSRPASSSLRASLLHAAFIDLQAAIHQDLRPAAELALATLGWTALLSPFRRRH